MPIISSKGLAKMKSNRLPSNFFSVNVVPNAFVMGGRTFIFGRVKLSELSLSVDARWLKLGNGSKIWFAYFSGHAGKNVV